MEPTKSLKAGVLCTPFANSDRAAGDADRLRRLHDWLIAAAREADLDLRPVQGALDSYRQIADRIYDEIAKADLVVAVAREVNSNVYFETGFAHGIGKPVLYVVRQGEQVPFDVQGIEHFPYTEIDDDTRARLTHAIGDMLKKGTSRHSVASALSSVRMHLPTLGAGEGLYGRVLRHAFETTTNLITSWSDKNLEVVGRDYVLSMGTFIMSQLQREGFATAYHSAQPSWRRAELNAASPDYFDATREAVRRGVHITRVYVIDHEHDLDDSLLRERAWADSSAGLEVKYLLSKHLPQPQEQARDFGLWDDELDAEIDYATEPDGSLTLHQCHYWSTRSRLTRARSWRRSIEREALPCPDLPSERALLKESAHLFLEGSCTLVPPEKPDCSAYHTSWQPLRLLDATSTPRWHAGFYTESFRRWSDAVLDRNDDEQVNVLITGLADYAMLYWIAQSVAPTVRDRCVFHVLDICQTPLESCKWLQRRLTRCEPPMKLDLEVYHRDVFHNGLPSATYDLIASDAFLTRFASADEKQRLLHEWMRLLRPGGALVTTARVREHPEDITPDGRTAFVDRVAANVADRSLEVDVAGLAARYAGFIESYPFASETQAKEMIRAAAREYGIAKTDVEFALTDNWEMTPALYARIVVTATT